jgi:hypothetical protein
MVCFAMETATGMMGLPVHNQRFVFPRLFLSDFLLEMTVKDYHQVKLDLFELWREVKADFLREYGMTIHEAAAHQIAEAVKRGVDLEYLTSFIAAIPDGYGRGLLIRRLEALFPGETWPKTSESKRGDDANFRLRVWLECDKLEKAHQQIAVKIDAGIADHKDRLKELFLRAELASAREVAAFGNKPPAVRVQEQEIAEIIWALNWLLRLAAGFSEVRAPHADAVRRCGVKSTPNLKHVTGLGPLPDLCVF